MQLTNFQAFSFMQFKREEKFWEPHGPELSRVKS
jgi:hypothetical protein